MRVLHEILSRRAGTLTYTGQPHNRRSVFLAFVSPVVGFCSLDALVPIFVTPQPAPASLGYRAPLLSGDEGTAQTVAVMRQLIDEALSDAGFVRKAVDIVRTVAAYDDFGEAHAIFAWVRQNIRFTKDPVTKEKLYPPTELLKIRAGDCDDISMLIAAFGMALGYAARLITIGASQQNPGEFSHVYVELEVPPGSGNWVPMDAARIDSEFGLAPPAYTRKRAWSLSDDSYQDLSGTRGDWVPYSEIVTAHPSSGRYEILLKRKAGSGLNGCAGCGLGQDSPDLSLASQALTELPTIIAASSGQGSSVTSPYGSFQTQYSPGYGVPGAGYGVQPTVAPSALPFPTWMLWVGLGALLLMGERGRR